jgi:striatin 1/3/4
MDLIDGSSALAHTMVYNGAKPTSVDFIRHDQNKLIASYTDSQLRVFDVETGKVVQSSFKGADSTYDKSISTQMNRVLSHPVMPLAITAHEDHHIRFFDTRSAECSHSMVAHLDAVSSLDFSPNGLVLVSGGHDSSVRLWDVSSYACLQEFSSHRKKYDEAIHCVRFHSRNANDPAAGVSGGSEWLATGGADSCTKLYNFA